jgi:hypothetical protein
MRSGLGSVTDRLAIVLVAAGLAYAVAGCSESSDVHDWPIATYPNEPDNGSSLMSLTGRLTMVDGCVVVIDEADGVYLPVFRTPGSQWRGGEVRMDEGSLKLGQTATFDGGGDPLPGSIIPEACADVTRYFSVYGFKPAK